ncbi:hypothetical protein ACM01_40045 [Streptomyces viridochromogenes]|uniref:Uncharacterized protein n=1 Tax=Streptomyces viridochromogenes TaxID=1938 RepID=A0A0J7YYL4_STRVR|nr:hypothetical protein [Streptomyces viridochromogenes]KMS68203.1 hypothetical protein ACM01_40045 [Streptomyces viridochromogenes]
MSRSFTATVSRTSADSPGGTAGGMDQSLIRGSSGGATSLSAFVMPFRSHSRYELPSSVVRTR